MSWTTVYSKTAKGLLAATGKGKRVTKEQLLLLKLVDGTSSEVDLLAKTSSFTEAEMHQGLESLANDGYLKAIGGVTQAPAEEDDLGSYATLQVDVANTQAFFDAQAEVEMLSEYQDLLKADREALIAKLDEPDQKAAPAGKESDEPVRRLSAQEAKAALEALAKEETRLEEERRAKAKEDELARQIEEHEAGVQRALELWGKEEADAKAKADAAAEKARGGAAAQELARKQKEEAARVDAERKAREEAEALAKAEAEQQARRAAEQRAKALADAQARAEAEEFANKQKEEASRAEANRIARAKAETLRKAEEEERIRREGKQPAKAAALAQLKAETEALARRQEEQKTRMEAKRKAREEDEARAKAEAQARAEAEAAARIQKQQAENAQAERQARDAAEQRAKAEEQEKIRQAEQQAIAEAEARVRAEAKQPAKVQQEEAARIEADARAKAEAEAEAAEFVRKQQEEQARDEEERIALQAWLAAERLAAAETESHAKAEAEAEELASKQLQEAARAEAERQARDEAESRAREEAAEQARREAEQQAIAAQVAAEAETLSRRTAGYQAEAETEKEAYAQAARLARTEQEEESRTEAVRLAREELEARTTAEAEQQAQREAQQLASADAKLQARAETAEFAKKSQENESGEQTKRLAREEAEKSLAADKEALARVTVQFDFRVAATAHAETTARTGREDLQRERDDAMVQALADVAERDRRGAVKRAGAEAKAEPPTPALALASASAKQQPKPALAVVKKEQAKPAPVVVNEERAEPAFSETAEQATEGREHDEAVEPVHEEREEPAPHGAVPQGKKRLAELLQLLESWWSVLKPSIGWGRIATSMFIAAVCVPLLLFQFASLDTLIPLVETIASARLGEPVSVGSLHGSLWPSPHLRLEDVRIGATKDIKISAVRASPALGTLFDENKSLKSLEVEGLGIEQSALPRMMDWLGSDARQQKLQLATVILKRTALGVRNISVPLFDATFQLNPGGKFESAVLSSIDGAMNAEISLHGGGVEVDFSARQWTPPLGPKMTYDNLHAKAVVDANGMRIGEIVAGIYDGTARARATVSWAKGWRAEGELTLADVNLEKVSPKFTEAMPISGRLQAKAGFSMAGTGLDKLFDNTHVQGSFGVKSGALENIDLARIIRGGDGNFRSGAQTRFTELTGYMALSGNVYQYRQVSLVAGLLRADGSFDVSPSGALSGNISAELGSPTSSTRAALVLSGQAKNPQLGRSRAAREPVPVPVPVKPADEPS